MIKKTIKSEDLDGNPIESTHWFHMFKSDLISLEVSKGLTEEGDTELAFEKWVNELVAAKDGERMMEAIKEIVTRSYGVRGADNVTFEKSPELSQRFVNTDAYSELFMELLMNPEKMAEFVNGIMPKVKGAPEAPQAPRPVADVQLEKVTTPPPPAPEEPSWVTEGRVPTPAEIRDASPELLQLAFARKAQHG